MSLEFLTAALVALTALAGCVSAIALVKVNISRAQIDNLRGDRDDQEKRIVRQDAEILALRAEVKTLHDENVVLRSLKSGEAALQALAVAQSDYARSRAAEHHDILAAIQLLGEMLKKSTDTALDTFRQTAHTHEGFPG